MPKSSPIHPKVHLSRKTAAGHATWNAQWRDPRPNAVIKKPTRSLETTDALKAQTYARELSQIIAQPEHWEQPSEKLFCEFVRESLWGSVPLHKHIKKTDTEFVKTYAQIATAAPEDEKWNAILQQFDDAIQKNRELNLQIQELQERHDHFKEEAVKAKGLLAKMGQKIHRDDASSVTVGYALEKWVKAYQGRDGDHTTIVRNDLRRFVTVFGNAQKVKAELAKPEYSTDSKKFDTWLKAVKKADTTLLGSLEGRERDIEAWLRGLIAAHGKRKGQPISAGRRGAMRKHIIRFMTDSGLTVDRKEISNPKKAEVKRDRGAIRWLTKDQATEVAQALKSPWDDIFRIQVGLGLRPDELPTLKRGDFSPNLSKLTLSPLGSLSLKRGSRVLNVPDKVRSIIEKRLNTNDLICPKLNGKQYTNVKTFNKTFNKALKKAGKHVGVKYTMDCRIGRRTCATILLDGGIGIKQVADILGTSPQVIIDNYGAVIQASLDSSAAAI